MKNGNGSYGIYTYNAQAIAPITNNTITGNDISLLVPASALPDDTNVVTPNIQNHISIIGNTLITDTRLRKWGDGTPDEVSTYVLSSSSLTVPELIVMTIDAGITIKVGKFSLALPMDTSPATSTCTSSRALIR